MNKIENNKTDEKQQQNNNSENNLQKNNGNITNNDNENNLEANDKVYTLEELNNYLDNLSKNIVQTDLMKKYNVSMKYVVREVKEGENFANAAFGVFINLANNQELNPIYNPSLYSNNTSTINDSLKFYSKMINEGKLLDIMQRINDEYKLNEIKDTDNNSNYLVVSCDSNVKGGSVYIYDSNLNSVGNFEYTGSMYSFNYKNTDNKILKDDSNIEFNGDSINVIEFKTNYNEDMNKVKYSIKNGNLIRNVIEDLNWTITECAGCR